MAGTSSQGAKPKWGSVVRTLIQSDEDNVSLMRTCQALIRESYKEDPERARRLTFAGMRASNEATVAFAAEQKRHIKKQKTKELMGSHPSLETKRPVQDFPGPDSESYMNELLNVPVLTHIKSS